MKTLGGLYVISDEKLMTPVLFSRYIEQALRGGARIVQYRDKSHDTDKRIAQARELKRLCDQYNAVCIINDDIELAIAVDADGVHLGRHDVALEAARARLGSGRIIGVSCYNRFELALAAQPHADYIAFGSFFPSSTKPDAVRADNELLLRSRHELHLPVCAIGGITLDKAATLISSGADMLAVITDIWSAPNIELRCREFSVLFENTKRQP